MRTVALEEHFTTAAIREANADHPMVASYRAAAESGCESDNSGFLSDKLMPRLLDLGELRVAGMDAAGIDVQVISHTVPATESLQPDQARALAADANDALAEAIRRHPNRFAGFATLPMSDPPAAAAELDRAVNKLGFTGAMINGHVAGIYLDVQQYWTIFEAAQALGVPIYLHPNRPPQAVIDACYSGLPSAVSNALATGAWGRHIDTGLHVLRLIVSGVFDAFPALNLIIGHMGEALPSMIWRADTMLKKFVSLQRPVHQYFSDNVYVTTSGIFDYPPFAAALHSIGTDRILFSVDYPYSDNLEAISFFGRLPLSASDREKLAHGNADRLLRLPAPTDSVVQATP